MDIPAYPYLIKHDISDPIRLVRNFEKLGMVHRAAPGATQVRPPSHKKFSPVRSDGDHTFNVPPTHPDPAVEEALRQEGMD